MKKIALLGATGNIGMKVIEIVKDYSKKFKIISLSFNKNIKNFKKIINEFNIKPLLVSVGNEKIKNKLQLIFPKINFIFGEKSILKIVSNKLVNTIINAMSGSISLIPTILAIKKKKDIILANKEILVTAGKWIINMAKKFNVNIIPIDSEHSAIFQCIQGQKKKDINKIILTASGGSLRNLKRKELKFVKLNQVLKHPVWKMGKKITIDSATMANKCLEIIEAHWLFNIDYKNIEVILHKESIIHSMIVMKDGSYIARLGNNDMKESIQYAMTYPDRLFVKKNNILDLTKIKKLNFEKINLKRYPILKLAFYVGKKGGSFPAVFNIANEVANQEFIKGKISFLDIEDIIFKFVFEHKEFKYLSLKKIIKLDKNLRLKIKKFIKKKYI